MSDYVRHRLKLRFWQIALLFVLVGLWWLVVYIDEEKIMFFGEPLEVAQRIWNWFVTEADIYKHLMVTLFETVLAFVFGTVAGLGVGLWLGLSPRASDVLSPYITAANSMPRVILAPIFAMWFGLGIWSKVALAFTLVFFIVFFNVYRGIREVNPVLINNAKMLGASHNQLLRYVYLPSATSWVFSSLHTSVGMAFVGAVVGEYLGSASGVGHLILEAEGYQDTSTVIAGIIVLTMCALVLDFLVSIFEKKLLKWQPSSGSGSTT